MSLKKKIIIGISSAAAVGLVIILIQAIRKELVLERLDMIAEEGYETAADILFPTKKSEVKKSMDNENDYSSNNVIFV